jgi:hypothetical protein
MDLKTGTAKNLNLMGLVRKIIQELAGICCNTQASIRPSKVLYLSGVTVNTGLAGYYAIQAISDCTFTTLTVGNLATGSDVDIATKTLTAGHIWYLDITAITLAGGECLIYKV